MSSSERRKEFEDIGCFMNQTVSRTLLKEYAQIVCTDRSETATSRQVVLALHTMIEHP